LYLHTFQKRFDFCSLPWNSEAVASVDFNLLRFRHARIYAGEECHICYNANVSAVLSCKHVYRTACLYQWMLTHFPPTCQTCRNLFHSENVMALSSKLYCMVTHMRGLLQGGNDFKIIVVFPCLSSSCPLKIEYSWEGMMKITKGKQRWFWIHYHPAKDLLFVSPYNKTCWKVP
jgi:hypothetical protein